MLTKTYVQASTVIGSILLLFAFSVAPIELVHPVCENEYQRHEDKDRALLGHPETEWKAADREFIERTNQSMPAISETRAQIPRRIRMRRIVARQ